ncbi:MAG: M48 family metallopeptidase [Pseudomonadota bacterium]
MSPRSLYLSRRDWTLGALAVLATPASASPRDAPFDPTRGPPGLSPQDEERLGDLYVDAWNKQRGVDGPRSAETQAIDAYLTQVGTPLTTHLRRPLTYTFEVDTHPEYISGFALPGGRIIVGSGILTLCDSEDALAAVLGHEIMHVDLGHTTQRMAEVQQEEHIPNERRAEIPPGAYGASGTHEQELAADREGVIAAVQAGYSPYGLRRLFELFQFIFRTYTLPPNALTIEARIAQLDAMIQERGWTNLRDAKKPLQLP